VDAVVVIATGKITKVVQKEVAVMGIITTQMKNKMKITIERSCKK
jgi:hypothetical protein